MDRTSTSAITTIFLVASVTAGTEVTARPLWEAPKIETKSANMAFELDMPVATSILIATPVNGLPFTTPKDRVIQTLESYAPGHPAGDPSISSKLEDIATAIAVIQTLPSGIPIPTVMRNDDGEIGMFWDNNDAYVDINIDSDGSLSLFSRVRSTGKEDFFCNINVDDVNADWAHKHLAALSQNY